jgi:hypothetical protein
MALFAVTVFRPGGSERADLAWPAAKSGRPSLDRPSKGTLHEIMITDEC